MNNQEAWLQAKQKKLDNQLIRLAQIEDKIQRLTEERETLFRLVQQTQLDLQRGFTSKDQRVYQLAEQRKQQLLRAAASWNINN